MSPFWAQESGCFVSEEHGCSSWSAPRAPVPSYVLLVSTERIQCSGLDSWSGGVSEQDRVMRTTRANSWLGCEEKERSHVSIWLGQLVSTLSERILGHRFWNSRTSDICDISVLFDSAQLGTLCHVRCYQSECEFILCVNSRYMMQTFTSRALISRKQHRTISTVIILRQRQI